MNRERRDLIRALQAGLVFEPDDAEPRSTAVKQMEALDSLAPEVRAAIRAAPINFNAEAFVRLPEALALKLIGQDIKRHMLRNGHD